MEHICSNKVSTINLFGIYILENDLKKLLNFTSKCGINSLNQCFNELSDLIKFLLYNDLNSLIDNIELRKKIFPKINLSKIVILLDKVSHFYNRFICNEFILLIEYFTKI